MGEFKKGDFVRRTAGESLTTNAGRHGAGFVGQIADIRKGFTSEIVFTNGHAGLIEMYEPWQPRVGERVRYTGKSTIYSEKELIGIEGVVAETGTRLVVVNFDKAIVDGVRTGGAKYIENLEPVLSTATSEQPAILKIEAGKFYKTRDGRKVGPVRLKATHGSDGPYRINGLWNYLENGLVGSISNGDHKDDLIAEWIDKPAAKPSNDNAKPNFKVGDRVRGVINPIEYEVLKVHANGSLDVRACGSWCQYTSQRAMDFVNITRSTTIVALIENGQPKPSSTPHVHTSTGAAEKEAKRLAAKYKGKKFGVFTLTTTHEEAAPVYDHKWQNMAALGLKIDAIKELRAVAGLDLLSAKRAVEAFEQAA
ncbi:hypothetical protein ATN81_19155 [Agrobacterium pusense]|uniref:hypothetical protein n=1 Tax=Agrobacterium pusense TaxID=648995 RepID=UPI000928CDD6|nr:hypothetical protein [Agrobacterium pusense]OJH53507.1 hypothetical protein ATN81_19155 [Agrobacterium pusense]OJH57678.1 hypothetical protein BA725_21055 [Agrobacterium pusense]